MTREQETIEKLNRFKTIKVLYGNTFAMTTEQLRALQEDIETALNMLKEKDELHHKALGDLAKADRENIQLKKQIDLMAEEINETDRGYTDYCEMKIECDRNCKDCIKQYFERKARKCTENKWDNPELLEEGE